MTSENLGSIYAVDFRQYQLPLGIFVDGQQPYVELKPAELRQLIDVLAGPAATSSAIAQMREYLTAALMYLESGGQSARRGGTA
jgi:hypothetical protein